MKILSALATATLLVVPNFCFADEALDLRSASRPLEEGVPEVATERLRKLLRKNLPAQEKRLATLKLAEALIAAGDGESALKILGDPQLRNLSAANFWRGQAFASLGRWQETAAAYDEALRNEKDPALRGDALFGKAESFRALGQRDEALHVLAELFENPRWSLRARFRATELLL